MPRTNIDSTITEDHSVETPGFYPGVCLMRWSSRLESLRCITFLCGDPCRGFAIQRFGVCVLRHDYSDLATALKIYIERLDSAPSKFETTSGVQNIPSLSGCFFLAISKQPVQSHSSMVWKHSPERAPTSATGSACAWMFFFLRGRSR